MSEGRKPAFRIVVRNSKTNTNRTVGTLWPLGDRGDGAMSMTLGERPYKDKPGCTEAEALAALQAGARKGSGYFINVYPCGERRQDSEEAPASGEGAPEELPF